MQSLVALEQQLDLAETATKGDGFLRTLVSFPNGRSLASMAKHVSLRIAFAVGVVQEVQPALDELVAKAQAFQAMDGDVNITDLFLLFGTVETAMDRVAGYGDDAEVRVEMQKKIAMMTGPKVQQALSKLAIECARGTRLALVPLASLQIEQDCSDWLQHAMQQDCKLQLERITSLAGWFSLAQKNAGGLLVVDDPEAEATVVDACSLASLLSTVAQSLADTSGENCQKAVRLLKQYEFSPRLGNIFKDCDFIKAASDCFSTELLSPVGAVVARLACVSTGLVQPAVEKFIQQFVELIPKGSEDFSILTASEDFRARIEGCFHPSDTYREC
jgi:hypothetical protein